MARGRQITAHGHCYVITNVFKPATIVHKVLKDTMGECLHSTIRWPQQYVIRRTRRFAIMNVEEVVRVFDYSEDPLWPQHQTPVSIGEGRSEMDSESPIPSFECPTTDGPGLHGRETGWTRRDGQDRLKCPRDGSFETVPRIFNFLLKKCPKNMTGKKEK